MKTMRILTNGIELHVEEHSTTGEALVLLPYQGGQTVMWHDVIPHFTKDYRVIALDLRGFGQSDQPEHGYTMDIMAEDLRGVLDRLGIEQAHFIGNSLGGDAATCFASKYPQRALSLVNLEAALMKNTEPDGPFEGKTREEAEAFLRENRPQPTFASREDFEQQARESWTPWNHLRELAVNATVLRETEDGHLAPKQTDEQRMEIFHDLFGRDWMEYYSRIQCPVLFMPCEEEETLPRKLANIERYSANLPHSKTVVLPNSEHLMTFDHSNEVAAEVLKFLEETR